MACSKKLLTETRQMCGFFVLKGLVSAHRDSIRLKAVWQQQGKSGAFAGLALHADRTPIRFHNHFGNAEPQTNAAGLD